MESAHVAVDIGGSSVKISAVRFLGDAIEPLRELTVPNRPLRLHGSLYIDVYQLFNTIKNTIKDYIDAGLKPLSLGVDTYGNGYGILNGDGDLLGLPYFYKDGRTKGVLDVLAPRLPLRELYGRTGVFPTDIRVLMQLFHEVDSGSKRIEQGEQVLLFPDLMSYFFTRNRVSERSMASVASLLGRDGEWCHSLMEDLGIPKKLFGPLVDGGENGSKALHSSICIELGTEDMRYVDVLTHDTESALLAAPGLDEDALFVSLGTSVVFGTRNRSPVISDAAYEGRFKNMVGAFGKYSLCRDYTGLWLWEQCMAYWKNENPGLSHEDILSACSAAEGNDSYFDVNSPSIRFYESSLPETIRDYCRNTGQRLPESMGEVALCVLESIVLETKWSFSKLANLMPRSYQRISAVGGGVQNPLLLQMLSDALALPVFVGSPFSATMGNVLMQLYALGKVKAEEGVRELACRANGGKRLDPRNVGQKWERALSRLEEYKTV